MNLSSTRERLQGIYTIVLTPFRTDGMLDLEGLQELIARQRKAGVHGLLIGGTYGEFATMNTDERNTLIQEAVMAAEGLPVLACTAHSDPREVLRLTEHAVASGATASMLMPPFVSEVRQPDIVRHFKDIYEATQSPLVIYNTPGSGTPLSPEALLELAEVDGVVGVKQGVTSAGWLEHTQSLLQGRLKILCASDLILPAGLALGMDGGSCTNASLMPELFVRMYNAANSNDWATTLELHQSWAPLRRLIRKFGQPQTTKAAMELIGLPSGPVRAPLLPLDDLQRKELAVVLANLQLLPLAA